MTELTLTENACAILVQNALTASALSAVVTKGMDNIEVDVFPLVQCKAEVSPTEAEGLSVYRVKTSIHVYEMAKETNTTSSLADVVFSAFSNSNTLNNFNASGISGYYVYDLIEGNKQFTDVVNAWRQTLSFTTVCALY